jgi:hypothetical protein
MRMSDAEPLSRSRPTWTAVGLVVVAVYFAGATIALWTEWNISAYPPRSLPESIGILFAFGWFALVGAVLVSRRPRNLMGWLLVGIALPVVVFAAGNSGVAYLVLERGHEPNLLLSLLAWPNNWYWYVVVALVFVYVPLLFPTGRLLTRRWRIVAWLGALWIGGMSLLGAVAEDIGFQVTQTERGPGVTIPNPVGVTGLAHVEQLPIAFLFTGLLVAALIGSFASLVVRFRRSRGIERRQMTWLVLAAALVPPTIGLEIALDAIGSEFARGLQGIGFVVAINAIPLAIGLAVLRYRLYDIDRIVSRTVSYGLLTALLLGVYAAGVVGLGGLIRSATGGGGGDLVVAASTLAVAALFGPARRRIQEAVDRRFNRSRYDAQQTVEAFAQRLRDEVDLDTLSEQLRVVASATVHPRSASVWLRTGETAP